MTLHVISEKQFLPAIPKTSGKKSGVVASLPYTFKAYDPIHNDTGKGQTIRGTAVSSSIQ
jgi:hypothetical protein